MTSPSDGVTIDERGWVVVIGDIDVVSAPMIEHEIRRVEERLGARPAKGEPLVVDVRGAGFIDSSGLRVLLAASRRAAAADRRVELMGPGSGLLRLLDITGTGSMFDLADPPVD
jgi:anti-anti-sigma factor